MATIPPRRISSDWSPRLSRGSSSPEPDWSSTSCSCPCTRPWPSRWGRSWECWRGRGCGRPPRPSSSPARACAGAALRSRSPPWGRSAPAPPRRRGTRTARRRARARRHARARGPRSARGRLPGGGPPRLPRGDEPPARARVRRALLCPHPPVGAHRCLPRAGRSPRPHPVLVVFNPPPRRTLLPHRRGAQLRGALRPRSSGGALRTHGEVVFGVGKLAAVMHEEALRAGDLVRLARDLPHRALLVGQVGTGQLEVFGRFCFVFVIHA